MKFNLQSVLIFYFFNFKKCPENDKEPEVIKMMGWKVPTYVVEPEESHVLYKFISLPTPEFKSLKLIVSHIKLKKYRFPGQYEDASEIGSNHMQRFEDKRDTLYYTEPNFKKWVDDSTLRCGIFGFCLISFPQNEKKNYTYKLRQVSLSRFVYFLREVCLLFNF